MSSYVSEKLKIDYRVTKGLVQMLSALSKKSDGEVWCILSEIANVCALRLTNKPKQRHSWTTKKFPNTDISLRIDMDKFTYYGEDSASFSCKIALVKTQWESFTQEQVNEYITEKILLGDENV